MARFLSVSSSVLVGFVLIVVPWTALWEANSLLHPHPHLKALVLSGFFRGAVSGLGLVNVLVATIELRRHRGGDGRT